MIYKLTIPYLLEEYFETDEDIKPLNSNIIDWSIEPDTLEVVLNPNLDALKTLNVDTIDYLDNLIDGFRVLKKTDTTIEVVGSDSFSVNDVVWCESEPMIITYKNSSTSYTVERLYPRTHVYNGAISKDRPLSIIGCFGYIENEEGRKVKWVFVEELSTNGAGAILTCSDILKSFDRNFPFIKPTIAVKYIKSAYTIMQESGMLNFVANLGQIVDFFFLEDWESSSYFVAANPFEVLIKSAKLRGYIIRYSANGDKYLILKISQPSIFNSSIHDVVLENHIAYSGGYNFKALAGGVKVNVKADMFTLQENIPAKGESIEFGFNFGSTYNQYQTAVELDMSGIVPYDGTTPIYNDKAKTITFFRQLINSGVASVKALSYGSLIISKMPDSEFTAGYYYTLSDAHKFNMFLKDNTDVYLLCVRSEGEEAEFLVLQFAKYSPVAPTILVKYVGAVSGVGSYCVQLINPYNNTLEGTLSDYLNIGGKDLESANIDGVNLYYDGLGVQLFSIGGNSVYTKTISTVSENYISLSSSANLVLNKEYILRLRYVSPNTYTQNFLHYSISGGGNV